MKLTSNTFAALLAAATTGTSPTFAAARKLRRGLPIPKDQQHVPQHEDRMLSSISPTTEPNSSRQWRLFTDERFVKFGWKWGVDNIWFHSSNDCSEESRINIPGNAMVFDSSHASYYDPEGAFGDRHGAWGGRPIGDGVGKFWIGMEFPSEVVVRCVTFDHPNVNIATKVLLEAMDINTEEWKAVAVGEDLVEGMNAIPVETDEPDNPNEVVDGLLSAPEWRLFTTSRFVKSGWAWAVNNIWFHSSEDCSAESRIDFPFSSEAFDSGNAGSTFHPEGAFGDRGGSWGGRSDESGSFWIGMKFPTDVAVRCVTFDNHNANIAEKVTLQAKRRDSSIWQDVGMRENLVEGAIVIRVDSSSTLPDDPTVDTVPNDPDDPTISEEIIEEAKGKTSLALAALENNNPELATAMLQEALSVLEEN